MKDIKSTGRKKQIFLCKVRTDREVLMPKPIKAMDLNELFSYYKEKHLVTLIKNGDYSPEIIKENTRDFRQQVEKFMNQELNYALFLKDAEMGRGSTNWPIKIEDYKYPTLYKEIQQHLSRYLSESPQFYEPLRLKQNLSDEEMLAVHDLCKNKFSNTARLQLIECIQSSVSYFKEKLDILV